jgi:uncharacterized cofD-like protein
VSIQTASVCASYNDGSSTTGEVEVDGGMTEGRCIQRIWLEPSVTIHPAASDAISRADAIIIGPGSFYTSLMPPLLVEGVPEAIAQVRGPVVFVANLLTEGRGMEEFSAGEAVLRIREAIGRRVDTVIFNTSRPGDEVLERYAAEHKRPLPLGDVPPETEVVQGPFWTGSIARHQRRRLAYAMWGVLARRLLW